MQVVFAAALTFLVYLAFAATIMRVVPTSDAGLVPVKDNTEVGGLIPAETEVLIAMDGAKVDQSIKGNLTNSLLPRSNAAVVLVHAGPTGKVTQGPKGEVTVGGKLLPVTLPEGFTEIGFLKDEYLGTCVAGACAYGEPVLFPVTSLYGLTLEKSDFSHGPKFDNLNDKNEGIAK